MQSISMPRSNHRSLLASFAAMCMVASLGNAQAQDHYALRILTVSTFTDNVCNDPCVCIVDPIPQPIGGRIYLAPAVSIPEISALAGNFRIAELSQSLAFDGRASYITTFDPAFLSRLTLDASYGGVLWTIDSGYFVPTNPPFPTLIRNLVSPQSGCTTLHLTLQTVETCVSDFDDGSGKGIPDGGVTVDDLLFYVDAFSQGNLIADIESADANGIPDEAVTIDDLLTFLTHFEQGC